MAKRPHKGEIAGLGGLKNQRSSAARDNDICDAIYNAVMEHRLPPGTKLTEAAFSSFFGVSRTVIRKALFRLAQKNVVELRPNRGAIVACPDVEETHDVFSARRIIEMEIIRQVAGAGRREQIRKLQSLVREEQDAQRSSDRHTLVRLTGDFHILLAEFAGNKVLSGFLKDLVSRTSLIIALYEAPGAPTCATHDHDELIDLIEKRDPDRAAAAMVDHLDEIEGRLNLTRTEGDIDLHKVFNTG